MSAPMSMEEWQSRLRAQKQQDRNNKNKSAQMLHSYQAKDEDEGTKKIRESRRDSQKAQKDAAQFLHNYRPNAQNLDVLTPSKGNQSSSSNFKFDYDGPLPPTVTAPSKDNPRSAILEGSVSSIAANFTGASKPTIVSPGSGKASPLSNKSMERPTTTTTTTTSQSPNNAGFPTPATGPTDIMSASSNFSFTEIASTQTNAEPQDWVQVTTPDEIAIPGSAGDPPNNTQCLSDSEAPEFETNLNEMDMMAQDQDVGTTFPFTTAAESQQQPVTTVGSDEMMEPSLQEEIPVAMHNHHYHHHHHHQQQQQQRNDAKRQIPQYSRLDVDFSFGLISTRAQPSMDAYMEGVQEILLDALEAKPEMKDVLWYNAQCPPFVQGIQKDDSFRDTDGRGNVQRLLVKAAVPIFRTDNITPKKARSFIIKALAAALRQGYFLRIAEEGA